MLALVLLYGFVVNFSAVESRFHCSGKFSSQNFSRPATVCQGQIPVLVPGVRQPSQKQLDLGEADREQR